MAMLVSNVYEESKLNTSLLQSDRSQRGKKGSKGVLSFLSLQTLENHSKSSSLSLMADLINSVMVVNPFFPIAFDPISSVRDLGILIDVYSFSAIKKSYFDVYISTFCTAYEPPKRKNINNESYILKLWLMNGYLMSQYEIKVRDGIYEREQNN